MTTFITGGQIIDGTGKKAYTANILLKDGRVAAIGSLPGIQADEIIDATGQCVAPGFIDAHSHNDWFLSRRDLQKYFLPFVSQGITTQVTGNCGFSPFGFDADSPHLQLLGSGLFSIPDFSLDADPTLSGFAQKHGTPPVNIVPLYGHMSGRISISGYENRPLTEKELNHLDELMEQALLDGAAGISLGLMYEPDRYAPYEELKRAAKIAAKHSKILSVHARACSAVSTSYQPPVGGRAHNLRALDEMVSIARETGVKVQFSHLIFVGAKSWRTADEALRIIDKVNAEGLSFLYDSYSMACGASVITVILPAWYLSMPEDKRRSPIARARIALEIGVTKRLLGFDFPDIVLTWVKEGYEHLCGKSVHDIAKEWRLSDLSAYLKLVELSEGRGRVLMHKYLTEEILLRLMGDEKCLYMTDAWVEETGLQNPACYSSFPEFLRRGHARGTLEKTVRQMTGATADRYQLKDRGYIREGCHADITVFDPARVRASDTMQDMPHGISEVLIAGQRVLKDGKMARTDLGHMILQRE